MLSQNINESYYESIQKLLSETRILDIIFNFSYIFCELSKVERENYINSYIDDFFNGRKIDRTDISIIKGIFLQQYNYYFNIIKRPDDKSRKIINQIVLQIANSRSEEIIVMESLKCVLKDIAVTLVKLIEMFSSNRSVDLEKLHKIEENDQKEPFVITKTRPLQPTNFFRGRDTKLNEIKYKMSGTAKLLLLNGMGGIGKTEICRKLFHEAINRKLPEVCNVGCLTYSGSLEQISN